MHSSRELRSSSFDVRVQGRPARLHDVLPDFSEHDRLGVVLREPCAAVGASALLTAAITAFYDVHRARGPDFEIYPDYFLFHVGRALGDHSRLDVWPRRKEVVVADDARAVLHAINDRGITRLAVPDGDPGQPDLDVAEVASARSRIVTCLAYDGSGRVRDGDVAIAGNEVTEGYVRTVFERSGEAPRPRGHLLEDGAPVETYRRIDLDAALALLASGQASARPPTKGGTTRA
jgi:hypothetical protein